MSRSGSLFCEQLDRLLEACFEELQAMSDEQVLDGEVPTDVTERASKRLAWARAEAGRRRLAVAKRELATGCVTSSSFVADVTTESARAYIVRAAADSWVTLAARKLDEMSEDDVLRLYRQIRELEASSLKTKS